MMQLSLPDRAESIVPLILQLDRLRRRLENSFPARRGTLSARALTRITAADKRGSISTDFVLLCLFVARMRFMADECLFCRIVSGELPATIVYEDENSIAFLDHRPLFPGHTLLVPRQHVETLGELPTKTCWTLISKRRNYLRVQLNQRWKLKELLSR